LTFDFVFNGSSLVLISGCFPNSLTVLDL